MYRLASVRSAVVYMFTFSYYGSLRHYTLDPIIEFERHQDDIKLLASLFQTFKNLKSEELQLVRKAAALSAAIVIGTFSWPTTNTAFWLSRLLWYISLWFSIFALVGFSQQRLIDALPDGDSQTSPDATDGKHLRSTLQLLLRPKPRCRNRDLEQGHCTQQLFVFDWWLAYTWQYPLMLVSYSWLCFLLGYGIYLLTPVLPASVHNTDVVCASVEIGIGGLAYLNFEASSWLARRAIHRVRQASAAKAIDEREVSNMSETRMTADLGGMPENVANT